MGRIEPFVPEKLVIPVLISRPELTDRLLEELRSELGDEDFLTEMMSFEYTRYYEEEMGGPLQRFFVAFRSLVDPGRLAALKRWTNRLELEVSRGETRRVNLDPGLLSLSRFVLASTKNGSHRIPLSAGIYAEVTLVFEKGAFRPLPWTYPDYRSERYREALGQIRKLYRRQLAAER
jgi:hypothetical protein